MQNTIGIAPNIVRTIMISCMNNGNILINGVGEKNIERYIAHIIDFSVFLES